MKILYFLNLEQYDTARGIIDKSFKKAELWRSNNCEVELVFFYTYETDKTLIQSFGDCKFIKRNPQRFIAQYRLMRLMGMRPLHEENFFELLSKFKPDVIYHRTLEISSFIPSIPKVCPMVVEINGNEIGNFATRDGSFLKLALNKFRAYYFKRFLGRFLKVHKGIVFVTHELLLMHEQTTKLNLKSKSVVIPNGIATKEIKIRKSKNTTGKIRLVFLGTPNMKWHGLDIILEIASKTTDKFEFHIIGESFSSEQILPSNVIAYGYLPPARYKAILAQCHIGIGTLALNAAGINEASPLKVREYAAAGLPVIIGYTDTAFINSGVPDWALVLSNSREQVLAEIDKIVSFCEVKKDIIVPEEDVARYFSSELLEKNRLDFFKNIIDNNI